MNVIDLTRALENGTESYPGDHVGLSFERLARAERDGYNFSSFTHLEAHCGTHIDSPLHFIAGGTDVASLPLRILPAVVVSVNSGAIDAAAFADTIDLVGCALLLRTGWDGRIGSEEYYRSSPYLTPAAARLLVDRGIALLGIDFPSPDPSDSEDFPVHHTLLSAGIPIVEGLVGLDRLNGVTGRAYFVAFPMKVAGMEGSPVRAAAIVMDDQL